MVIGAQEPRFFLHQWSSGLHQCQEFNFSTQLGCKLLEYRNLTHLQLLQPCLLQVEHLKTIHLTYLDSAGRSGNVNFDWISSVLGPSFSHLFPPEYDAGRECIFGSSLPQYQPVFHPHCGLCPAQLATGNTPLNMQNLRHKFNQIRQTINLDSTISKSFFVFVFLKV